MTRPKVARLSLVHGPTPIMRLDALARSSARASG